MPLYETSNKSKENEKYKTSNEVFENNSYCRKV